MLTLIFWQFLVAMGLRVYFRLEIGKYKTTLNLLFQIEVDEGRRIFYENH